MKKLNDKQQEVIASILAIIVLLGLIIASILVIVGSEDFKINTIEDGYYLVFNNDIIEEQYLDDYVKMYLDKKSIPDETKEELCELLRKQGVDLSKYWEYYVSSEDLNAYSASIETTEEENKETSQELSETAKILQDEGLVNDINLETSNGEGLNFMNGLSAQSYSSLADAETTFGTSLGLYYTIDALENYEMIRAYTVNNNQFMVCAYAINQDGTSIEEDEDLENSEISTMIVKLSLEIDDTELAEVYEPSNYSITENYNINNMVCVLYFNSENEVNLARINYNNTRYYTIHSSDAIDIEVMKNIIGELYGNLEIYG